MLRDWRIMRKKWIIGKMKVEKHLDIQNWPPNTVKAISTFQLWMVGIWIHMVAMILALLANVISDIIFNTLLGEIIIPCTGPDGSDKHFVIFPSIDLARLAQQIQPLQKEYSSSCSGSLDFIIISSVTSEHNTYFKAKWRVIF